MHSPQCGFVHARACGGVAHGCRSRMCLSARLNADGDRSDDSANGCNARIQRGGGGCCGLSDRCVCGICGGGTGGCSVWQKFWLEHCIPGNFFRGYAGGCVAVRRFFVQPRIFAVVHASCRGGNIPCSGGRLRAQSEKCGVWGARCAAPCFRADFLTVKRRRLLRGITVKIKLSK